MTRQYFGTDGVRGRVGVAPITPDWVLRLGYAMGRVLIEAQPGERPGVLIGKDTRISGYMLEAALEAGFSAAGVDVYLSGPLPTPAVAHLTRALRLQAGLVISASHNPYDDNGIKFFSGAGAKLPDSYEAAIESALEQPLTCVAAADLGKARRVADAAGRYVEFCKGTVPHDFDLRGMRLVVDCANGAAYHVAPPVFHELGAEVIAIGDHPDGININAGFGATVPETLQQEVLARGVDAGIALDGDGDRLVMVDSDGRIYDGDQLLYVIAADRQQRGELAGGVVGTLMSNLGFEQALSRRGIAFARAAVGDRYVLEMMIERDWVLGGENSGTHPVPRQAHHGRCDHRRTAGADRDEAHRQDARRAHRRLALYPQRMINVRTSRRIDWRARPDIVRAKEQPRASWRATAGFCCARLERSGVAGDGRGAGRSAGRPAGPATGRSGRRIGARRRESRFWLTMGQDLVRLRGFFEPPDEEAAQDSGGGIGEGRAMGRPVRMRRAGRPKAFLLP
jgi:phosphoglucosamine mutase